MRNKQLGDNFHGSSGSDAGFLRKTSELPKRWSMKGLVRKIKEIKNSDLGGVLVIGIDFGTTYSGAAWATVDDFESDQINLITSWPQFSGEEGKAPTALFYQGDEYTWGYEIPHNADPVQWFKLLLVRDEDLDEEIRSSDYVLHARRRLRDLGKSPTDVIADYLRALWKHTLETIHKARSKSSIAALTFHVVITVPAIWKDYARKGMQEAAEKAGILQHRSAGPTTLAFVPEPEAAALVTLWEQRNSDLNTGDLYVVCDAGGGTVDLITYRVGEKEPIELHEAVIGSGGLCGGIFIDEKFETACRNRLGLRWANLSQAGIKAMTKGEWEDSIKRSYTGRDASKEYIVAIPAEAFKDSSITDTSQKPHIKNGRFHFSSSDIQKTFADTLAGIDNLVDGQIKSAKEKSLSVTGIVLVGGLGSSPYLYNHLQDRYEKKGIRVIQSAGLRPRTAICRGAIFKGFLDGPVPEGSRNSAVSVVSTIARQSLGVTCCSPYKKGVHLKKDKFWDESEHVWWAQNQMKWYLRKGDDVSRTKPVRYGFYNTFETEEEFDEYCPVETIRRCDEDVPPSRLNAQVKTLCSLGYDLGHHLTFDMLDDYVGKNSGKELKRMNYDIVMLPSGASTEFAVYHGDVKLASESVRIEYE